MNAHNPEIYVNGCVYQNPDAKIEGSYITLMGEPYYCIRNYDQIPPFFMSLVSSSDHWLFISSSGGLTAGRRNAESALFPYYTVDKITENAGNTGLIASLLVTKGGKTFLWEPFSAHYAGIYHIQRNLYKNVNGNKLIFEEVNDDLNMIYRYTWRTSDQFGLVKTTWLTNDSADSCSVDLVDGLQNLLPYGATTALQTGLSNLLNGYKRNELEPDSGLAMFTLSSTLTDLAEPSESLKATTVWQVGFEHPRILLSTHQLDTTPRGIPLSQETDVRGQRGAYLINAEFDMPGGAEKEWSIVAEVNQDSSQVTSLINTLKNRRDELKTLLESDIDRCSADLERLVANADGLQASGDRLSATHHFSNVLFNIMRGGIFVDNHKIQKTDLYAFIASRNRHLTQSNQDFFDALPATLDVEDLLQRAGGLHNADLERLCYEYLPLTFSRRHGDPSRPWNQFSINIKNPDGSLKQDYQGNWRDIFQNWEPLAYAYPGFVEGMLCKFLNATTADGYNPYRLTRDGVEWEAPSPDDPWANIGYWSDHQIIYLEKLLEISERMHPGKLSGMVAKKIFSHANVPYRIKPYGALLEDSYNTILFDRELDEQIKNLIGELGTDAKLVLDARHNVFHTNLTEKLLILMLAKLSNFVPEGGIWMNTQRPEWNDANNALVGKGLSVVTLCYLRRFIVFTRNLLAGCGLEAIELSREVEGFLEGIASTLKAHIALLTTGTNDTQRRVVLDQLGQAGSDYRWQIYQDGISGEFVSVDVEMLLAFLDLTLHVVEYTIHANRRADNLYHAYNVLHLADGTATVNHLYEMLEGQVAILSSGMLSGEASLVLLKSLKNSLMYRADQHSYMLYPDRDLPGFLLKNTFGADLVAESTLIPRLVEKGDHTLILQDENGAYHFNGSFRNAMDVTRALEMLGQNSHYATLIEAEKDQILALFEKVFNHSAFTGRSGTFFAYEGLGSIYWHMVSKLLLAAQEAFFTAVEQGEAVETVQSLAEMYYDIRQGIGFNKSPDVYGAFPTDPYSHTPAGQGAKQPGMTGQVKEELVTRIGEMGVSVMHGLIAFHPILLRRRELLDTAGDFACIDVNGQRQSIALSVGSLAFTYCQVPIVYRIGEEQQIEVTYADGRVDVVTGSVLDKETSTHILQRDGQIRQLTVTITELLD